jgi:hypothetical protein
MLLLKYTQGWWCGSVIEHLPSMFKALYSILSLQKKEKRKKKKKRGSTMGLPAPGSSKN